MNRNEEYRLLMQELDAPVPAVRDTLIRAKARNRRRKWVVRPVAGLAAAFACFVILVNFCAPVAYACSRVPVLRDLAEAVTFSRSLTAAVENDFVQPIDLQQTDNGVTAKIEYLIVDQKQVNVFFRLESNTYEDMSVTPAVCQHSGGRELGCAYYTNGYHESNGSLQSITIDFMDTDVPESLRLLLNITDNGNSQVTEPKNDSPLGDSPPEDFYDEPDYVAHFDFLLEFDPTFTAQGKTIEINETVTLGDQQIKLTDLEVYPTHLRLNVEDVPGNTAWLKRLDFYIETDDGSEFHTISNGISATGTEDTPMMVSYRADSPYFYEADHLKIVITGAEWLDKDMETIRLNLETGEADRMPDGAEIYDVTRNNGGWIIAVRAKERGEQTENSLYFHQVLMSTYYYPDGSQGNIDYWSTSTCYGEYKETKGYFYEVFTIKDYSYDEVWLVPAYSHEWFASEPIELIVH